MADRSLKYYLDSYLAGTITAAEWKQLQELLRDEANMQELQHLMDDQLRERFATAEDFPEVAARIKWKVQEQAQPARVHFLQRQWLRYAAAVILIAGIGAYLWNTQNDKRETRNGNSVPYVKQDLPPGGNRATLTLSDGKTIVLDSIARGAIAKDGGAEVRKADNGQIVYASRLTPHASRDIAYNTMTTPRGGQYQLTLADGTKVWLNAESSITYPTVFNNDSRKVSITGEAYFEVTKDAKRPFRVVVSRRSLGHPDVERSEAEGSAEEPIEIEVLGTHFNVNAYADEPDMRTTLIEGSVKITKEDEQQTLKPGQQAIVKGSVIRVSRNVNTDEVVAWKNGQFEFTSKRDIKSIMRQIGRWYDVDIEFRGEPKGQIGGSIPRNVPASKIFSMFEATGAVHFKIEGKKVIVLP